MDRTPPSEEPCVEYLRAIAEQLGVDFEGEDIRARVARRRPLPA